MCKLIDGTNGTICGDYIEDTPADPRLISSGNNSNVNSNCIYTGGGGYSPDTHNFMSYSRIACRDRFSIGQELRMRDALSAIPELQNVISTSCESIYGDTITCNDPTTVFIVERATTPYNWSVSSNLEIVGTNNGSTVTVKAINSNISASGWVRIDYNGGNAQFNVWVGKPLAPESGALYGPEEVDSGSLVAYYYQGVNQDSIVGAKEYYWELPGDYEVVTEIDYFGEPWQRYDINGRQISHVFTGYGQEDGLVSIRGTNKCGEGEAIDLYVEHGTCEGPNCGGIPIAPPSPIPNSANVSFNLDFTSYPVGTYYLYIYDSYANEVYSGTSTNIDKTVSTIDKPNGTYFLHIHDGNEVIIKQLIVSH